MGLRWLRVMGFAPQPKTEWRIHLGAHRTATTHFQDTLAAMRPELLSREVDFIPRDVLRGSGFEEDFRPGLLRGLTPAPLRRLAGRRKLSGLRSGGRVLALSEEKCLGYVRDLLAPELYPSAAVRLRHLAQVVGDDPLTVFLSLRDYGPLLASAYSQCLRMGNRLPSDFSTIRTRVRQTPPDWRPLVRLVSRAFPSARLVIWAFEDYVTTPGFFLDRFVGFEGVRWPPLAAPDSTRGLSAEGVSRLEALGPDASADARRQLVEEMLRRDPGTSSFKPFSPEESEALHAAYLGHIADLEAEFPGALLRAPGRSGQVG